MKNQTARSICYGPSGGLFGIDQEVVTLRGLSRRLRASSFDDLADLSQAEFNPYSPVVCGL